MADKNEMEVIELNEQPKEEKQEEIKYEIGKIRGLLKKYGKNEEEIDNFIKDLAEYKEDVEEIEEEIKEESEGSKDYEEKKENNKVDENDDAFEEMAEDEEKHEEYLLNAKNLAILKATEEGRKIIRQAPEMQKEELKKAILSILEGNK